jgi:hypothetical protein
MIVLRGTHLSSQLTNRVSTYGNVPNVGHEASVFVYKQSSSIHICSGRFYHPNRKPDYNWMDRFQGKHNEVGQSLTGMCCSKDIVGFAKACACNCLICLPEKMKFT